LHERRNGFLYGRGRATTEATESLIAQLTTPRRENRKIRHENEILKVNEPTHVQMYQIIPKHTMKSRETIPLTF
jgi:hypothetical protein